jgi:YidC/Oxa1 family membrane protein insertase
LAFLLFVGPKHLDVLQAMNPPLDRLVDYGWFSIVAKPLFLGLRYLHDRWTHNYGWAIVILTVLINLAMFPLKLKSIRSAQEMQRIAPLVKSIQEKYKGYKFNDPRKQRMNQEVMKLYQEHHINPLGGCLPMVVQLPFLYGFYKVLDLSIELRHASWFAWIKDLSAPDPLYILPTLMIMPLVFGIMFYSFASGLVLYWLTGTIVGIAQQMFINRMIPIQPPVPAPHKTARAKE